MIWCVVEMASFKTKGILAAGLGQFKQMENQCNDLLCLVIFRETSLRYRRRAARILGLTTCLIAFCPGR
jgi:hypothetical protein